MPNNGIDYEKCMLVIHHWEPSETAMMSQGHCSLRSHFHECSPKQCYGAPAACTHIPWILFSCMAALVQTTVIATSAPCVSWLALALLPAVCSQLDERVTCFILSPGSDPSGFPDFLFAHAYPPVRPPSLCLCLQQMSGAPSASSACHLFGVVCPPTAFALHVGKVFVSFGTAQIAQDKRFVCFVHSFA